VDKQTVSTRFGKTAKIELGSLAGTPYSWEITSKDDKDLTHEVDVIPSSDKKRPCLKSIFKFQAKKPGTYEVELELNAPFMSEPAAKKRFKITFH